LYPLDFTYRNFTHVDISGVATTTTEKTNTINPAYTVTSLGLTWFLGRGLSFDLATDFVIGSTKVDLTTFSLLLSYKR
jgi:hypothetical protein